jgi:hypothetical protein
LGEAHEPFVLEGTKMDAIVDGIGDFEFGVSVYLRAGSAGIGLASRPVATSACPARCFLH